MTVVIDVPPAEPTIERPDGEVGRIEAFAAGLHRASTRFEEVADEAAQLANLTSWEGAAFEAYRSAAGTTSAEHSALRGTIERVGRAVSAHGDALTDHLRRYDDLVERRSRLDQRRDALIADVEATTDATDAQIEELRRRARELGADYRTLRADHDALHRRVDADERLLAQAFRSADTTGEALSDDGGTTSAARSAMRKPGAPGDGASPEAVNDWWNGLTPAEQAAVVAAYPGVLGSADGLPASARGDANRVLLAEDLAELTAKEQEGTLTELEERMLKNARETETALQDADGYTDPIDGHHPGGTLWMYDPAAFDGEGTVALGYGDLDTADDVAVFTPGIKSTMGDDTAYYGERMRNLYESSRYGGDGSSVATMFWLGYDSPDAWNDPATLGEGRAAEGGEALADDVAGMRAARADDPAHMTAVGHSYGSTTTAHAAADHGLDVDDIALLGSPGAGPAETAGDLGVGEDHVFVGRDSRDGVADLGDMDSTGGPGLGRDPSSAGFGANRFEAEDHERGWHQTLTDNHNNYFDVDSESLYNLGRVVDGDHDSVNAAPPNVDTGVPGALGEHDPEFWDDDVTHDEPGRSDTSPDQE
ncbi:alpha/beta hydrolase [uncultured Nocardioides sp.]|uniref:alpha/beta hydrolase n=1 Tax=uncultured Nocardioides sp. TaxID=198441 RepID=UPI002604B048|nr:alpha/beta hydrolase [uncultured Nocardioides sp.]